MKISGRVATPDKKLERQDHWTIQNLILNVRKISIVSEVYERMNWHKQGRKNLGKSTEHTIFYSR